MNEGGEKLPPLAALFYVNTHTRARDVFGVELEIGQGKRTKEP